MTSLSSLAAALAAGEVWTWPPPDSTSPFFITGPALISFSGGRTSALMLWLILWAHGGVLPPNVHVVFANTGKEREETLRFVYECGIRWGVVIHWVEWSEGDVAGAAPADRFVVEVGYNSASRNGEPYDALIRKKRYLPNAVTRFCTVELKVRVMKHFMLARGYTTWINVVGLRADERKRVMKAVLINVQAKERWVTYCPLALAGIVERIVLRFWLGRNRDPRNLTHPLPRGFDLGLRHYEGNCDMCFLKALAVLMQIERERPGTAAWWVGGEDWVTALSGNPAGSRFVTEYRYADLTRWAADNPQLPEWDSLPSMADCTDICATPGADDEPDPDDDAMAWLLDQMKRLAATPPVLTPAMKLEPALGDLFEDAA